MRSSATIAVTLTASVVLLSACSGASSSDLFESTANSTSATDPASSGGPSAQNGSGGSKGGEDGEGNGQGNGGGNGQGNGGGSGGGGGDSDAGAGGGSDAGPSTDAGGGACPGGQTEAEPNDQPNEANAILGLKVCGAIAKGGAKSDVDYFTFVLPAGSKNVVVSYTTTDRVLIFVTAGGQTIDITQKNQKLPVIPGGKYQIEVQGVASTPSYTLTLVE